MQLCRNRVILPDTCVFVPLVQRRFTSSFRTKVPEFYMARVWRKITHMAKRNSGVKKERRVLGSEARTWRGMVSGLSGKLRLSPQVQV
jgi:hypothetical protein